MTTQKAYYSAFKPYDVKFDNDWFKLAVLYFMYRAGYQIQIAPQFSK